MKKGPARRRKAAPKAKPKDALTEVEMREILVEIAENPSNRSAQIQAIRTLKEMQDGEQTPTEGFERLDNTVPIRRKAA